MPKNEDADVELAKKIAQVSKIRRKENLDAIQDLISFLVRLSIGLISLVGGIIGEIAPAVLPLKISNPRYYIAVGVGLLAGKGVLTFIAKVANTLK